MVISIPSWVIAAVALIALFIIIPRIGRRLHDKRWVRWFGHRWPFLPASCLAVGVMPQNGWGAGAVLALGAFGVAWSTASDIHDSHICEECIAGWPADASAQAENKRGWLWLSHNLWKPALPFIALQFIVGLVHPLPPLFLFACLAILMTFARKSRRLHNDLKPWCPYCNRGDDGGDDREDAPTPPEDHSHPAPTKTG